ncbi:hypothetical protein V5P93_002532 [Actinokineospora auranticolor]|uniref:Aldehyde dehydrogenase family protein n=1 Tax=Actinokineospora auranticolor TaxID=155976 RepID=A0A2S6GMH8_9PSEU|nr:hypothetical protein [Actinokineospora auranticolor]PPK66438.1 hypothetical protein CLV40_110142 [Actinokineospora auranticolor]
MRSESLYIAGVWVQLAGAGEFTSLDPAAGTPIATLVDAGAAEVDAARAAASASAGV